MSQLEESISAFPFDRLPPASIEAERCLLGSMMLATTQADFELARRVVTREAFYQADHQIIFDVLCDLRDGGRAVDAVLAREELKRRGLWEEIGGGATFADILGSVPSAAHGPHYAKEVREKYALRQIIGLANDVLRDAYAPSRIERATELAMESARRFASVASTGRADEIVKLGDAVMDVYDRISNGEVRRVPTGLHDLDDVIGGLAFGRFTQIGGRPGMGKSQLVKQIVRNVADTGRPVGIVTIEETREKIGENCLSAASGVENNHIAFGTVGQEEWSSLADAVQRLARLPVFISDRPVKLHEVEAAVTALAIEHKCEVIAVDYLQCIDADIENENREITKISKALKGSFKRLGVAGIAAVQLNRGNEVQGNRRPTLRDLRGSGSLEQDGDTIILLHRDDYYRKGDDGFTPDHKLEAIIEKNKDGCTGIVPLWFSGARQTITNWNGGIGDYSGKGAA
jgi:replicative DNA helicase